MISSTKLLWIVSGVILISIVLQVFALFLSSMPYTLAALALSVVSVLLTIWQGYRSASEEQQRFEQERKVREQAVLNERRERIMRSGRPSYEPIFDEYRAMRYR
jgi:membrane protein implicated in regulation of membrane protease activity